MEALSASTQVAEPAAASQATIDKAVPSEIRQDPDWRTLVDEFRTALVVAA